MIARTICDCAVVLSFVTAVCFGQSERSADSSAQHYRLRVAEAREVMHCLKAGDLDWLGDSDVLDKAKTFRLGLRHDRRTYPGEDVITVVVFESREQGDVFELTRKDKGLIRTYRIQNNGSFKLGAKGMQWPGEILGGIWTHDYIEANIRKIMHGPKIRVPLKMALRPAPHVTCQSYVDAD